GLEAYDRNQGVYRGPVARIEDVVLTPGDEAGWRRALAGTAVPRDIPGWHPAVILELGEASARIGIEGVEEDEDGHYLPISDAAWARPRDPESNRLRPAPATPADLWAVGD